MKIATLQFAPRLGDVQGNMRRADALLKLKLKRHTTKTAPEKHDECGGAIVEDGQPGIEELRPDILVLPEMAFTGEILPVFHPCLISLPVQLMESPGYNFPSLQAIKPYLESQGKGPTAQWARETARHLKCKVCVGYPEISKAKAEQESHSNGHDVPPLSATDKCFNSLLVVDENGEILLNYRKQFLYYTDETWALEGDVGWGFRSLEFDSSQKLSSDEDRLSNSPSDRKQHVPTSFGICMDINPYRFEAPFTAWEFANQVLASQSQLVILSTAWLTIDDGRDKIALGPDQPPDMDTFQYWIRRFWPLIERRMTHDGDIDCKSALSLDNTGTPQDEEKRIILVFANRTGVEEGIEGDTRTATYAGTSTIVAISQKLPVRHNDSNDRDNGVEDTSPEPLDVKILCWDIKGATEEGICFADTMSEPSKIFTLVKVSDDNVS
jgi:protein N-terminal amidase